MAQKRKSSTTRSKKSQPKRTSEHASTNTASDLAQQYARDVVAGKIVACHWVKQACKRHLNDLERAKTAEFPYRFDPNKANRACKFVEALPHTKGKWAAKAEKIKLERWQLFAICSLFGWVAKTDGTYRFREAYICVPRKNGKSILSAAIGNLKFAADGEYGAEVYSGATTEKQAWEVFRPARMMAVKTPAFVKAFGVTINAKSLTIESNGSRFEPVIGKPGDGASPSCAIVDEYHEHADDTLYDTMKTGMGARENPLLLVITTAGSDRSGPCYALQKDLEKVLDGMVENDRLFGIIYTVDESDDWMSEAALVKANPNFGVSVSAEFLKDAQKDAINSARKQNVFKTKHLNVWVNADVAWMNMVAWDRCADKNLDVEQFRGEECIAALDLASRIDLADKLLMFRRVLDGKPHFYVFCDHYLNESAVEQAKNSHYAGWRNEGLLTVTPGNVTDYNWIADDLVEDTNLYTMREVPHDPYHAAALIQFIQARADWNQSVQFVEVRQSVQNMSPAMKEVEALVLDGRLHHNGDPLLAWAISNVVCHRDNKDNIFPRKEREENKIDPAVCLFMATGRWMVAQPISNEIFTVMD